MRNVKRKPLPVVTNCDDCGACCTEQEALPVGWYLGNLGDPNSLPPELLAELKAMADEFMKTGWPNGTACVWYDAETKRCKHYEHRPDTCREENVVPGNDSCLRWRRIKGIDKTTKYEMRNGRVYKQEK